MNKLIKLAKSLAKVAWNLVQAYYNLRAALRTLFGRRSPVELLKKVTLYFARGQPLSSIVGQSGAFNGHVRNSIQHTTGRIIETTGYYNA